MASTEFRTDLEMRETVEEAMRLLAAKGPSAAAAYLYRFGVPAPVIERVMGREADATRARKRHPGAAAAVLLSDVLATYELAIREPCLDAAPTEVVSEWPLENPDLGTLLQHARAGLKADSVGISLFNDTMDELTWIAIDGDLRSFVGSSFARRHSMCDVCFQTAQSQLFLQPHLYFEWMAAAGLFVNEALITPLRGRRQFFFGTLWAVATGNSNTEFTAAHLGLLKLHAAAIPDLLGR